MKTKLLLSFLLLPFAFCLSPCTAQVPQGFNYQAIARDGGGTIIANTALPVKITIQTSTGTVIYEELFSSITSNQFGLISLVVGTGTWQSGSAATFSAIDWKAQTLYLKTQIQYPGPGWTVMGTSQIWAVPYSQVAKDVAGPLTKLGITGNTDNMEEALFEVKNKAGKTVFAVYNEGIRAYVGNGDAKGAKGGFSVGGYDATKGSTIYDLFTLSTDSARLYFDSHPTGKGKKGGFSVGGYDMTKGGIPVQNYLEVSKDSVRIYIDSNPLTKGKKGGFSVGGYDMTKGGVPVQSFLDVSKDSVRIYIDSNPLTKGKKGGFAVGGYDMTKGTNDNYLNVNTDATGIIKPVNRILWYPLKNAFLTGKVRIGTPDSVGENSFASGYESKARGLYSQALGFKAIANGDYSTAIGKNAVANSINSFAFGDSARATNAEGYAIGRGAIASGYRSFAFGSAGVDYFGQKTSIAKAIGDYSFAFGQGSVSLAKGAFSIGIIDSAKGLYSLALGYRSRAIGDVSTAMGFNSTASGTISIATGVNTTASGEYSTAMGYNSMAKGNMSIALGVSSKAEGLFSTAIGYLTKAVGWGSISLGYNTIAAGESAMAMGINTTAKSYASFVIGRFNDTTSVADTWWSPVDPLFIIGNGSSNNNRSNAMTVLKSGMVGIGTSAPVAPLNIIGDMYIDGKDMTSNGGITFREGGSNQYGAYLRYGGSDLLTLGTRNSYIDYTALQILRGSNNVTFNGRVGIGTTSPAYMLDVIGEISSRSANAFRLRGDSYSTIIRNDGADFYILVTNSGDPDGSWNNFRPVRMNLATGNMYIGNGNLFVASTGNVGIGTSTPSYKLHVNGSVAGVGAYINISDIRFKKDIEPITGALEKIMALQGITFNWDNKTDSDFNFDDRNHLGFAAQDLEKVVPQVVSTANDKMQTKSVAYSDLVPLLTEAIKEQQKQIESYKSQIETLQEKVGQIGTQQKEIDDLKSLVNSLIASQTAQANK